VRLIATHRHRLANPRLKDFDQAAYDRVRQEHLGFQSFLRGGGFPDLGEGSAPLVETLMPLVKAEYGGWLCLDAESSTRPPKASANWNRDYLREHLHW
jgi:inosose dehydratase